MASNVLESYGIDPEERLKRMERLANDFTIDRHQPIRRYADIIISFFHSPERFNFVICIFYQFIFTLISILDTTTLVLK